MDSTVDLLRSVSNSALKRVLYPMRPGQNESTTPPVDESEDKEESQMMTV